MSDVISRSYAIKQARKRIKKSNDVFERIYFDAVIDFLRELPDYGSEDHICQECTWYCGNRLVLINGKSDSPNSKVCEGAKHICSDFIQD